MKTTGLGTIGDKVIFENERLRVWVVSLEPGQLQSRHVHELPYLVVAISGGNTVMRFDDGREIPYEDNPGEVLWRETNMAHELENISGKSYSNLVVELKHASQAT